MTGLVLAALLCVQDPQAIHDFLKRTRDDERAERARRAAAAAIDGDRKGDPIWTAVYLIVSHAAADRGWLPKRTAKAVSAHLKEIGFGKSGGIDAEAHLQYARKIWSKREPAMQILALAHLEAAARWGKDISNVAGGLGLVKVGERWATEDTALLLRMREQYSAATPADVATDPKYSGSKAFEVQYFRLSCMLQAIERDPALANKLKGVLKSLKSDGAAKAHVEALLRGMEAYLDCDACMGKHVVTCGACNGKGKRTLVCQYCNGEGWFEETKPDGSTLRRGCPSCLGKDDRKKREEECNFCEGKGKVPCEKCKWLVPTYGTLVTERECSRCKGSGTLFRKVAWPCFLCRGLGKILEPSPDPRATVSPAE